VLLRSWGAILVTFGGFWRCRFGGVAGLVVEHIMEAGAMLRVSAFVPTERSTKLSLLQSVFSLVKMLTAAGRRLETFEHKYWSPSTALSSPVGRRVCARLRDTLPSSCLSSCLLKDSEITCTPSRLCFVTSQALWAHSSQRLFCRCPTTRPANSRQIQPDLLLLGAPSKFSRSKHSFWWSHVVTAALVNLVYLGSPWGWLWAPALHAFQPLPTHFRLRLNFLSPECAARATFLSRISSCCFVAFTTTTRTPHQTHCCLTHPLLPPVYTFLPPADPRAGALTACQSSSLEAEGI